MLRKRKIDFSAAILISLILVVFELLGEIISKSHPALVTWLPFIVMAASLLIACNDYSKGKENEVKFKKVFLYGMKITMVVTVFIVVYRLVYFFILFPETKAITIEEARNEMLTNENLPANEVEEAVKLIGRVFIPFAIVGSILSTLLSGAIGSIISASVAKKQNTQLP